MCLSKVVLAAAVLGLCVSLPAANRRPVFSVDVNVVNVVASVRDENGNVVSDLDVEDFTIEENGQRQQIKYFARQSEAPLTLGLLVDTSASQRRLIRLERLASTQFFKQVLRPKTDRAFLIKFDTSVDLLQDLTSSQRDLRHALGDLRAAPFLSLPDPRRAMRQGSVGTYLYDAVFLASDEVMRHQEGRKALVLITDGVDMGSVTTLATAVEHAQRADSLVYCVRYFDPAGYFQVSRSIFGSGPGKHGSKVLKKLAAQTGGRAFTVGEEITLGEIFDRIQEDLRSLYFLGYNAPAGDAEFRRIRLRTTTRNHRIRTRPGYYPRSN